MSFNVDENFTITQKAVIDIGSNSIHLVIYNVYNNLSIISYSEKCMCCLGYNIDKTGKLYEIGKECSMQVMHRFMKIIQYHRVLKENIIIFATAAARISSDGNNFTNKLSDIFKINVFILSGEEEALYSSYAILMSCDNPDGIVVDIGGGSIEMAAVYNNSEISHNISLPFGSLKDDTKSIIDTYNTQLEFYRNFSNIYIIGGGIRNIAKLNKALNNYPVDIRHNYVIEREEFINTLIYLSKCSDLELIDMKVITNKRVSSTKNTAKILLELLEKHWNKVQNIIFSGYGIREGVLYKGLYNSNIFDDFFVQDLFYKMINNNYKINIKYSVNSYEWIIKFLQEFNLLLNEEFSKVLIIISILQNITINEYTGAKQIFFTVINLRILKCSHKDIVLAAYILYCTTKHSNESDIEIKHIISNFISKKNKKTCKIIASLLNLLLKISLGDHDIIEEINYRIEQNNRSISFFSKNIDYQRLFYGDSVMKLIVQIGNLLKVNARIGC